MYFMFVSMTKEKEKKRLRILRNEDAIFCLKRKNDNEKNYSEFKFLTLVTFDKTDQ